MKRRKTGEGMKKMRKTPEKQYQLAVDGIRPLNVQDSKDRLLAFCMDVSIMLCPIALWNIILLAVLGNIISISGIKLISIFIGGAACYLYFISEQLYLPANRRTECRHAYVRL